MASDRHFSHTGEMQNVSDDLTNIRDRFEQIMGALEATAANTHSVWEGAGEENAKTKTEEFNEEFNNVQEAFRGMIGANDEVTAQMVNMHARLNKTFEM
ncbi:WXG100 family type VII secretion target [Nocardiopsis metallicus]|uniref:Uncharacterized protein YukE n=1 Tax=Nocardiopsis metallicus TaxID=179819 RepID=A0A840W9B4_9ACTN|nr:hypothetical protein [Nocardiopsis metallicus]MBB5493599.1 uncharacterized protein YukE [Nocardiopsis metallicus]